MLWFANFSLFHIANLVSRIYFRKDCFVSRSCLSAQQLFVFDRQTYLNVIQKDSYLDGNIILLHR